MSEDAKRLTIDELEIRCEGYGLQIRKDFENTEIAHVVVLVNCQPGVPQGQRISMVSDVDSSQMQQLLLELFGMALSSEEIFAPKGPLQ